MGLSPSNCNKLPPNKLVYYVYKKTKKLNQKLLLFLKKVRRKSKQNPPKN